jgi:hypothetical protein
MLEQELMRRLEDQIMILNAIKLVKEELIREWTDPDSNWIKQGEVLMRLTTLYSLLDVDRIMVLMIAADTRNSEREVA